MGEYQLSSLSSEKTTMGNIIRKNMGTYNPELPALDPTTSFYEFLSYQYCCWSLGVKPSVQRFTAYNNYFRNYAK